MRRHVAELRAEKTPTKPRSKATTAQVITAMPLSSYQFNSQGFFIITLANGQVWEQRDGPVAHWQGPASQYLVNISKGAMGSFNLTVAREGAQYKVRRVPANARRG